MAPPTLQVLGTKPKEPPPTPAFPSLLMHPRAFESHGDSAPLASPAEALPSVTELQQLPLLFLSRPRPPTLCPPPGHPRDSQVSSLSVHDWDLPVTQSDGQALHRQPPLTCLWMLVDVCDSGRDSPTVCPRHPEERRRGLLRGRRQPHRPLPAPLPPWSPASETGPPHRGREPQAPPGRPPPPGRRTCGRAAGGWVGGKRPPPSHCPVAAAAPHVRGQHCPRAREREHTGHQDTEPPG